MAEKTSPEKKNRIHVFPEWCKGCAICVAFCPKGVLEMKKQKAVVANPDKCIMCLLCLKRCPDLAIGIQAFNGRVDEMRNGDIKKPLPKDNTKGKGGKS